MLENELEAAAFVFQVSMYGCHDHFFLHLKSLSFAQIDELLIFVGRNNCFTNQQGSGRFLCHHKPHFKIWNSLYRSPAKGINGGISSSMLRSRGVRRPVINSQNDLNPGNPFSRGGKNKSMKTFPADRFQLMFFTQLPECPFSFLNSFCWKMWLQLS